MTDKQIIIDGVDVSGCEFATKAETVWDEHCRLYDYNYCIGKDCYYKQLKRKEQECEAYKMEADEGKEINAELKAENEEWKYANDCILTTLNVIAEGNKKLRQTLTEIKEICKNNDELKGDFNLVDCDKYKLGKHNLANRILQKISECEGNDD